VIVRFGSCRTTSSSGGKRGGVAALIFLDELPEKHSFSANRAAEPQESSTMSSLKKSDLF
jgi:hypothetical protein